MAKKSKKPVMDEETAQYVYNLCLYFARKIYRHNTVISVRDLASYGFVRALQVYPDHDEQIGTLSTYLAPHIQGAVKDRMRELYATRRKGQKFKDVNAIRFSQTERLKQYEGSGAGRIDVEDILKDKKALPPGHRLEVKDELDMWKKKNYINRKEYLILLYRYGYDLPMRVVGFILGYNESRISQIESSLIERLRLQKLPNLVVMTKRSQGTAYSGKRKKNKKGKKNERR